MAKKKREIPHFELPIIETHCHLDYLKEHPLSEILERGKAVGIEKVITISVSPDNLDTVVSLTSNDPCIFGTQGIHPHQAKSFNDEVEKKIRENLKANDKLLAVGEIGLDFYYNNSKREEQLEAFKRQLQIAIDLELPVVIHSRDADEDTIEILKEMAPQMKNKGVIHSFTSGPELAQTALDLGFCLGFNGIITFNSAENVREIVRLCPLERILLETDSPFLTPVPYRGVENAPFYLPFVAEKIAAIKDVEVNDVLSTAYQNTLQTFFTGSQFPLIALSLNSSKIRTKWRNS